MGDDHEISLEEASEQTATYRESSSYEMYNGRIAVAFQKEAIERVMAPVEGDVAGLRCYFAHDSNGVLTLVLVAYDAEGNDILREIADVGMPCPSFCGENNDLNS